MNDRIIMYDVHLECEMILEILRVDLKADVSNFDAIENAYNKVIFEGLKLIRALFRYLPSSELAF